MRPATPGFLCVIAVLVCPARGVAPGGNGAGSASGGIQLIGAGMSRTGTQSLHRALQLLGYHASHGEVMVRNRVIRTLWEAWLYDGAPFEPALQSLIDAGMNATFDVPFFFAYEELHRRYPDAKVLLSVRDTPEDWYKSCHKFPRHHAVNAIVGRTLGDRLHVLISWALGFPGHCKHAIFTRPFRELLGCDFGVEDPAVMEQHCVDVYRKHIDKVRSTIPTQQLLVYNVKEGWKPLCDFLGVPVPDTPFPRTDWNNLFGVIWDVLTNKDTPAARVFKSVAVWIIALLAVAVAGLRLRASYRRGRFASEKPKAT